jgi:hypothetical protein
LPGLVSYWNARDISRERVLVGGLTSSYDGSQSVFPSFTKRLFGEGLPLALAAHVGRAAHVAQRRSARPSRVDPRPPTRGARPCRRSAGRPWRRGGSSDAPSRSSSRSARCAAATPRCRRARWARRGTPAARGSSTRWSRGWGDRSSRRRACTGSSDRTFFCAVSLLSIESRLPAVMPTKRRGRAHARDVVDVVPAGCAIMPTRKPRASRKRPMSAPPRRRRRVIDVARRR